MLSVREAVRERAIVVGMIAAGYGHELGCTEMMS